MLQIGRGWLVKPLSQLIHFQTEDHSIVETTKNKTGESSPFWSVGH